MTLTTLSLVLVLSASPSEGSPACDTAHSRQMDGHTFLLPILQQSALITTHVGIREGLAHYDVPDLPVGSLGPRDISLVGLQQILDLGFRINDWVGLSGFARGAAVAGNNRRSLLYRTVEYELEGQLGVAVRLLREGPGTQVTARAHVGFDRGKEITVFPLLSGIVNNPLLTLRDVLDGDLGEFMLVPTSEKDVSAGVFWAQALGPLFSLQASGVFEYGWRNREPYDPAVGERIDLKSQELRVALAAALAADLGPRGIPVALMGEYLFITGEENPENDRPSRTLSSSTIALGAYYTGRANLQLGVGLVSTLDAEPLRGVGEEGEELESGNPRLSYAQLILRYIW
jgi:hypothetical protein